MQREITRELVRRLLPGAWRRATRGADRSVLAAAGSMAYPRGGGALHGGRFARRGRAGVSGQRRACYPAGTFPHAGMLRLRLPHGGQRGHPPAGRRRAAPLVCGQARRFAGRAGLGESAADVCKALLGRNAPWAGAVLDADALNALAAGKYRGDLPANTILTPHPGEAARLLGLTVPEVQADRESAAVSLAEKYHCVAVLKGHHTLVAAPDGTVWRNETGNAGLAKGGSGIF